MLYLCVFVMFNDYDFYVFVGYVKVVVLFFSVGFINMSVGSMWYSFVCFLILILVLSYVVGNFKYFEMLVFYVYVFFLCVVGIVCFY